MAVFDDLLNRDLQPFTNPSRIMLGEWGLCRAGIMITGYDKRISKTYNLPDRSDAHDPVFRQFGLLVEFEKETTLPLIGDGEQLDSAAKSLLKRHGAMVLRNARISETDRQTSQRNIFPNLKFHYDRTPSQGNYFSLFFRDPDDPAQHPPRQSSTLIAANSVIQLEAQKTGQWNGSLQPWYDLFQDSDIAQLSGDILLEQTWSAPAGTGEIVLLDNSAVMHASYYREAKGYQIGVRYLF